MAEMLKLLFIRHAQSIGNLEKRMQGQGEFELSEAGKLQAEKLARRLLAEVWFPTHVYSSPLRRTTQTAKILIEHVQTAPLPAAVSDLIDGDAVAANSLQAQLQQIQICYDDDLKEFQNGIFQGLTWAEAQACHPDLCHQLETSQDWIQIPNAESLHEARDRARRFIQMILQQHKNGDRLWIVSHSWILQHLIAELMGCDRSWRLRAKNTALFEFWIDHSRWNSQDQNKFNTDLWQVRRFNDYEHLQR
jgi:2,3-bisphosphoglycerate-dependent phosphoglycerate mutase